MRTRRFHEESGVSCGASAREWSCVGGQRVNYVAPVCDWRIGEATGQRPALPLFCSGRIRLSQPVAVIGGAGAFAGNMGAPTGCSGVHRVPKAGHSWGFFTPRMIKPLMHSVASGGASPGDAKTPGGVEIRDSGLSAKPLDGMRPMPRQLRSTTVKTSCIRRCACTFSLGTHRARIGVRHLCPARLELLHAGQHAPQNVHRLETGNDDRHPKTRGERAVFRCSHDRADVAGGKKTLHAVVRGGEDRLGWLAAPDMETRSEKLRRPSRRACTTAMALAGAVVSKPTARTPLRGRAAARRGLRRRAASKPSGRRRPAPGRSAGLAGAGTRSMSPNEQTVVPGRAASATAASMSSTA